MTGSRLVGTLANEMARRKARYGVVTMCIGGGQGMAGLFEACNCKATSSDGPDRGRFGRHAFGRPPPRRRSAVLSA